MRKESLYFSHDSNAKTDSKILRIRAIHGWEGYGMYWAVIEVLREQTGYKYLSDESELQLLCKMLDMEWAKFNNFFKDCLKIGLFVLQEKYFVSESLVNRMRLREANRANGSKGGKSRWYNGDNEEVKRNDSESEADGVANRKPKVSKVSKVKESKVGEKSHKNPPPTIFSIEKIFEEQGLTKSAKLEAKKFWDYNQTINWTTKSGESTSENLTKFVDKWIDHMDSDEVDPPYRKKKQDPTRPPSDLHTWNDEIQGWEITHRSFFPNLYKDEKK